MRVLGDRSRTVLMAGLMVAGLAGPSLALAAEDLDVTMRMVVDDADLTDAVVREIKLPEAPIGRGPEGGVPAARGQERARESRDNARAIGNSVSAQAREAADSIREKPDRPERPPAVPDHVEDIRDKVPPGLNR